MLCRRRNSGHSTGLVFCFSQLFSSTSINATEYSPGVLLPGSNSPLDDLCKEPAITLTIATESEAPVMP